MPSPRSASVNSSTRVIDRKSTLAARKLSSLSDIPAAYSSASDHGRGPSDAAPGKEALELERHSGGVLERLRPRTRPERRRARLSVAVKDTPHDEARELP